MFLGALTNMEVISRLKNELPHEAMLTRYVDIHSFLYFITQNKLRFARLDTFEDLNEGFSVFTAEQVKDVARQSRSMREITDKDHLMEQLSRLKQDHSRLELEYRRHQRSLFACCWYMGERESVAMWDLYSNPDSVAIRFNANQLIQLITGIAAGDDSQNRLQYGAVEYAELSAIDTPLDNSCIGFIKDSSFSHEQEFRFLTGKDDEHDSLEYELCLGDLKQIGFTIISHPKMEQWKIRNILNVLSCYELTGKFQPSELALKNKF
jgi:hypothetical protein